jgi:predicted metal-dependent HD superfamily phosphohydrolase
MLKETFLKLLTNYTADSRLIDRLWNEIEEAYSDKKRHYHNLTHLESLLIELNQVTIENREAMLFSLYYHDFVYNATAPDNEEQSAVAAEKNMLQLAVPMSLIENCKQQILATKSHVTTGDQDTLAFLDADLSILGQPEDRYNTYTESIRKEYLFYPSAIYNEGRKRVVHHFLAMDRIFKTDHFYEKYEVQARINLKNELESLNKMRSEFHLKTTNEWCFVIDDDGNFYEFFHEAAKLLDNTPNVEKTTYYPGFFDSGYYRFYYKNVNLNLEYDGLSGLILKTIPHATESDVIIAREVYELLKTVRNNALG